MLPDQARTALAVTMHLIGAVFFAVLIWTGVVLSIKVASLPTIAMEISSAFEYGALPAASLLLCARSLAKAYMIARNGMPRSGSSTLV
jgi:TRAP-type C4-dicarboxylate transport system permease small subunit